MAIGRDVQTCTLLPGLQERYSRPGVGWKVILARCSKPFLGYAEGGTNVTRAPC
jgi:hypothetical protein